MNTVILVPVKDPSKAKARLASILTPEQRCELARTMLDDLALALKPLGARVAFVTNSRPAGDLAAELGWRVFWETRQITESASVDEASRRLAAEGVEAVLRLPADIPLVRSEDVRKLLDVRLQPRSAVLVPSRDRMGTNAVLRRPPDLFPSRFGRNSFVLHMQEALRVQARVEVVELPRLALDLDAPDDLRRFLDRREDTATSRLLAGLDLMKRLT